MCCASSAKAFEVNRPTKRSNATTLPAASVRRIVMLSIGRRRCTWDSARVLPITSGGPSKSSLRRAGWKFAEHHGAAKARLVVRAHDAEFRARIKLEFAGTVAAADQR